jgi:glycosyltransferase involved in cell wall biosynthesis
MRPRLSIIIPVYNEMSTVETLLERVIDYPLEGVEKEIVVVESNSKDGSRAVVERFAAAGKIKAVYQDAPRGKGSAVKAGLAAASGEWVLIQDADLEYEVSDYTKLLAPLKSGKAKFVLGSRHLGHETWWYRTTQTVGPLKAIMINSGIWAYTQLFNILYGERLTDPATMYKVFRRDCLQGIHLVSDGFNLDWEIVAKLVRAGYSPLEFPVIYHSRGFNEGKKVRLLRDGWISLIAILRFRFGAL